MQELEEKRAITESKIVEIDEELATTEKELTSVIEEIKQFGFNTLKIDNLAIHAYMQMSGADADSFMDTSADNGQAVVSKENLLLFMGMVEEKV